VGYNANNLFRNSLAKYWIASSDEWYKGAYGNLDGTWNNYANGSDSAPAAVASGTAANTAVYDQSVSTGPADITNAGGLSPWGTMGQDGNVWEWTETALDGINNRAGESRLLRGGNWVFRSHVFGASESVGDGPSADTIELGFRVASVPEPSSLSLLALGGLLVALRRRRLIRLLALLVLPLTGNAWSQVLLSDSFNGASIDTSKWQVLAPLSDSSMTISNGNAVFFQRGILISQQNLPSSYIVQGRFAFTGGSYDQFQINLRTDGALMQDWWNFPNDVYVGFSRRGGDDGDKIGQNNIYLQAYGSTVGNFTFLNDIYYDFKIVDTGNTITLFLNDLETPFLATNTTAGSGNKIGIENRGFVPWWPTYDNQVKLDYITISIPEPSSLSLLALGGVVVALRRRR